MDALITELLFTTDLSYKEIAIRVGEPLDRVKERIAVLGLGWVRARERMSRGQAALTEIMERLLPGEQVVSEYPIGERLELDVYCPRYRLAAEFHGQQHFVYVEHFHRDKEGFLASVKRDERKAMICEEKGVALAIFTSRDRMSEDFVFKKLMEAMHHTEPVVTDVRERTADPYRAAQKEKAKEYRRAQYKRNKLERKL